MYDRIALVKTGWSDDYQGGVVLGRHAHINDYGEAGEMFNFRRHDDGRFYAYAPPMSSSPPRPFVKEGWLILFVAARKGTGPLTVVGWYQNATLHGEYLPRPEYETEPDYPLTVEGEPFSYCISADEAHLIPVAGRRHTILGDRFKRTPILYLRGNLSFEPWREEKAAWALSVIKDEQRTPKALPPSMVFPDSETRKRIEESAVKAVKKHLRKEYKITDRQKDNCGYDLLARHKTTEEELHIEVKGTSRPDFHFYMSRNEQRYMSERRWRLAMVTNALSTPDITFMTCREVKRTFDMEPLSWEATVK